MIVPFSPPDITELEIQEVVETLRSGWITTGPRVKVFEKRIADYCDVNNVVCLNSQSACAETALRLMDIGHGDEVIVPAYTYTASAAVVCHVGAKLVLVDSQKDCLEMDYDQMEAAINEHTKAIIPVDLAGIPCDYDRIFEIVERHRDIFKPSETSSLPFNLQKSLGRIAVLADTAHAFGAMWHGRPVGSIADFSSFSFHAVKNLTTAEGGALTWKNFPGIDDEAIYQQVQLLSLHGQSKDALSKTKLGSWEYDVIGPWFKCNMTDITAAIGLRQLDRYPNLLKRRREIIETYDAALKPLGVQTLPHYTADYQSSGHLYMTRLPGITLEQRSAIIEKMAEQGVTCNVHYKPLPMLTAYRNLGFDITNFPNAYAYFVNEITLPLHTRLTDTEVQYVINTYKSCF